MNKIEETDLKNLITKIENENTTMKKLSTRKGFYEFYFEKLKTSKTQIQAFNKVNNLYLSFFGTKRYSDFATFQSLIHSS
jgi:hypothetical protein